MIGHVILVFGILSGSVLWGQEARAPQTPLTREEIYQAVVGEFRKQGIPENQLLRVDDIELPAALSAATDRTLRVAGVRWDASRRCAQVRLECAPGQCVPFLVDVRMERSALPSLVTSKISPKRTRQRSTVRTGDRAVAVFLGERLHLTAAVICLEHGAEGDVIRVRNQDGHIFRARISGPGLLEILPQK